MRHLNIYAKLLKSYQNLVLSKFIIIQNLRLNDIPGYRMSGSVSYASGLICDLSTT